MGTDEFRVSIIGRYLAHSCLLYQWRISTRRLSTSIISTFSPYPCIISLLSLLTTPTHFTQPIATRPIFIHDGSESEASAYVPHSSTLRLPYSALIPCSTRENTKRKSCVQRRSPTTLGERATILRDRRVRMYVLTLPPCFILLLASPSHTDSNAQLTLCHPLLKTQTATK